jgi:CRISPR-associated protein Cmr4
MFKAARIMFLYTESSVHPGAGDSTGVVDCPIQREIHTNLPIIQGSELKGALREYFENKYAPPNNALARFKIKQVFGPPVNSGVAGSGGALGFSMSRVILFPLASLKGIFAYVTCPMCLETFRLDLREVNNTSPCYSGLDQIPEITDEKTALVPKGTEDVAVGGKVILSEFPFSKIESDKLNIIAKWLSKRFPAGYEYFRDKLYKEKNGKIHSNLVVIKDDIFKDLLRIKTEVVHRNKLENGISQNLWTEENLPSDTLLYSMLYAAEPYEKIFKSDENSEEQSGLQSADDVAGYFEDEDLSLFILGGNQTVGRGWIRATFYLKEDIS